MALSMLRQGVQVGRVIVSTVRLVPAAVSVNKRRTIVSKQFRKPNPDKPRPWPYETVKFTIWDALTEDTQDRFDENSRLIIIDGNIGVGKSTLAKKLAEELDFFLFPEATLDFKFIDDDGFDMRSLNHMFPDTAAPYDIERFYKNPKHVMAANFQYSMLALRYEQYLDAMAHLLSTGQGVILERCPYSDFVFAKAMHKAGYMDDYDMEIYNKMQRNIRVELFKPHIVIYLDAPIDVLKQRIKDRGLPYEQNTNVLTDDYLLEIDRCYKEEYLPSIKDDVEVVCYDWSTIGDAHRVVEDLERLPIEDIMNDPYHRKFEQWKGNTPRWWDHFRMRFTNEKNILLVHNLYSVPRLNHPCLVIPSDDIQEYNQICEKYVPPYTMGFNEKDSSHFLRMDANYRLRQRQEFYRTR